jgi:hypothetical protein
VSLAASLSSPDTPHQDCVPLVCYTRAFLKDPRNPVGTAVSDMFALGVSIQYLLKVSRFFQSHTTRLAQAADRVVAGGFGLRGRSTTPRMPLAEARAHAQQPNWRGSLTL